MKKPLLLCILDGVGIRKEKDGNAFFNANTPTFDFLLNTYPNTLLDASGKKVGLPEGQMGNSEVGHLNIGAGRVVYQPLELLNKEIEEKELNKNEKLLDLINHSKSNNSKLHIMGLISDGGVHSHINHLLGIIDILKENDFNDVCYHLFTDGRDVDPKSAYSYIKVLEDKIDETKVGKIATISGRYYAMDRDNNYDRLKKTYDAIIYGKGLKYDNAKSLIESNYNNDITDEFIVPGIINEGFISDNDSVLTFNFRPDRLREIFTALTNSKEVNMETKEINNLKVYTMFPVTDTVLCDSLYKKQELNNTFGEYISSLGLKQLRIAETEKYAHVTYFFDGGIEKDSEGLKKILIPSSKVATYDLKPEMSAGEITEKLLEELDKDYLDVIILNYANGDMVGHTGNYEAAIKAVEYVDTCLNKIYNKILEKQGTLILTADHGNCDIMWDENKVPVTSHTTSLVHFIVTKTDINLRKEGALCDIAPTMLDLLGIKIPEEMTGKSLVD